ncbi:uncharacterized protein LOC111709255 [Eurytemora carolleeae]|uniref:uncharacterized protein LOC111709255 n=1 Tax=Eurytemora carolleeae TaxID=1294199 RepID=UPI000C76EDED|nr:uncharacterized protein LOC111709255 [Eurytemora carolleeae]|eukprot:XP_023338651.1 uncharacterized protein LOC111709255 [Eurytemora affinis]
MFELMLNELNQELMNPIPGDILPLLALSFMTVSGIIVCIFKTRWFSIIMVLAQTINILSLLLLSVYMMVGSSLIHLSVYLHPFFPLVLLSLLFLGCGAQFTQTFSCAANLSNQYMAAIFIGMGVGVCVAVLCQLFCLIISTDTFGMETITEHTSAIYVLILVLAFALASADLYLALPLARYYQEEQVKQRRSIKLEKEMKRKMRQFSIRYEKENGGCCRGWWRKFAIFFNMFGQSFITFLAFPFIFKDVVYSTIDQAHLFPVMFSFLPHSLLFSLGALISCSTPSPPSWCWSISIVRITFIPLFLLSKFGENRYLPVIMWDWSYILISVIWSTLGGYCITSAAYISRSKWMGGYCLLGMLAGSIVSVLLKFIIVSNQ